MKRWDVLGIGCAAVDDLLYVTSYPSADSKVRVESRERHCGGLTATALVAAARQAAICGYAVALADDELSAFVLNAMGTEGIDISPVVTDGGASPIHSTIIVDRATHTRTIFFKLPSIVGLIPSMPIEKYVLSTRVLLVDHFGGENTVRAQRLALAAGVPVVADLERDDMPAFDDILLSTDHLIISHRFASQLTEHNDPAQAAAALFPAKSVVVVTCGRDGCWAITGGEAEPKHYPTFQVDVVDTTGCGDTFHGVYAAELARGTGLAERIRRASVAAALKATRPGAQSGIPSRQAVDQFLAAQNGTESRSRPAASLPGQPST